MTDSVSGASGGRDRRSASEPGTGEEAKREPRSLLPNIGSVVQAGAFGAALGGMTAGVTEIGRVRQGEITSEQAMENMVKSSAQSAATMAVASVAAQMVRAHPVVGFLALAAAGLGAFLLLSGPDKPAGGTRAAAPASTSPPADLSSATGGVAAVSRAAVETGAT